MNQIKPLDTFIRIMMVILITTWCFLIAQPFLIILVWAIILAVAFYPLFQKITKLFKGRTVLSAVVIGVLFSVVLAFPSYWIVDSAIESGTDLIKIIKKGDLHIPDPNERVQKIPLIGEKVYSLWESASKDAQGFIQDNSEPIAKGLKWFLSSSLDLVLQIAFSLFAVLVALAMMVNAKSGFNVANGFFNKVIGPEMGADYVKLSRDTIRSVVQGILLVSAIQAILAFAGLAIGGIPGAGLLAILVLIVAIIQLPPLLIFIPIMIYAFSTMSTTAAVVLSVYLFLVGLVDNILKPMLLGRGSQVPMLVILIGALGGLMLHGIIGLFVGSTVMAIGYQSYYLWLTADTVSSKEDKLAAETNTDGAVEMKEEVVNEEPEA